MKSLINKEGLHAIKGIYLSFFISMCASIFFSCNKDKDTISPVLSVSKPQLNDTISLSSGGIHIVFSTEDNNGLYEVLTRVTNADGVVLYSKLKDVHDKSFLFDEYYIPSGVSSIIPMVLVIDVSDHSDNKVKKTINFFVKP